VNPPTPAVGDVDDLYVDLVTSQLYKKVDAVTWVPEFSLIGPAGAAATVAVGLTTTGAPGSAANVNNTGTAQAAVFNFAIPAGIQGPQGIQGVPGSAADAATWSTFPATQDVDFGNHQLDNVTAINAPVGLSIIADTGDITLQPDDSIIFAGSVGTSGAGNTVDFGSVLPPDAPLARFSVLSSEVTVIHLDPLTQMLVRGQGDVRVESTSGDLNLIGDDVNIATTGATNVLNITSLAAIQNTAGGAINNTAGGAFAVQAGGLISITTPGQINIGSGNVFGATTSIEKFDFSESTVGKLGSASDLQIQNVASVSNSAAPVALSGTAVNITSIGSGNVNILTQALGTTPALSVSNLTGVVGTALLPQCAVVPTLGPELTNKTYVDTGLGTKLPNNADISLAFNVAAPITDASDNSPFIYVPAAAGTPTGTPTVIAGCVPLYVDITGGGAKVFAYVGGVWVAI
jgi:hypothetical protein